MAKDKVFFKSTTGDLMEEILQLKIASSGPVMICVVSPTETLIRTRGSWVRSTDGREGLSVLIATIKREWPDLLRELVGDESTERPFELPRPQSPKIAPLMEDPPRDFRDYAAEFALRKHEDMKTSSKAEGSKSGGKEGDDGPF